MSEEKIILDACCGGRMMWFEKHHPNALYIDARDGAKCTLRPSFEVKPDVVMDFRNLEYPDRSFNLVVFDPPHLVRAGENCFMAQKYGLLSKESWRQDISSGFNECWRVLKPSGVLIFKWNEVQIKLSDVLAQLSERPLFGHTTGRHGKTHWLCFMKIPVKNSPKGKERE
jgi:ubiquinone/menaquinone biosynthesis C-methylase UbiE